MSWSWWWSWSRLAVGPRLAVGFLVVVLTMVLLTALGVNRVGQIEEHLRVINDENSVKQRYAINFRGSVHDRAISLRDVVLAPDDAAAQESVAEIEALAAAYAEAAAAQDAIFADGGAVTEAERAAYEEIQRIEEETLPVIDEVLTLHEAGQAQRAQDVLLAEAKPLFVDWLAAINVLIDLEEEMNQTESAQTRQITQNFLLLMLGLTGLAAALAVVVGWRITRSITHPMREAVEVFAAVARGDLTRRLDTAAKDGLGELGVHANAVLARFSEVVDAIADSASDLAAQQDRIRQVSQRIGEDAQASATRAGVVAHAAAQVSAGVQTVAAGTEEMGASIREIAHSATAATQVASEAVQMAADTTATVSQLGASSTEIGNVVKVITTIAEQTNLLALNATIEAARAGESGKGFAVVATEVKELAAQTARATEDIARRVQTIQSDTGGAVAAISEISTIIARINDGQVSIASAVEEQTATAAEMARNVAEAATSSGQIADTIHDVAEAATSTAHGAEDARQAAADLARMSDTLATLIAQFTRSQAG